MAIDQNAVMAAMAAKAQGGGAPPQQGGPDPQQAAAMQQQQQAAARKAAENAPEKDTAQDKAMAAGSPTDEGGKMQADPIVYEIDMGEGKKRPMTPDQIKGMSERYSSLNYKHAQMKPVLDIVDRMLQSNPNAKPEHVAQLMMNMMKGTQSQPQFGQQNPKDQGNQTAPADIDPFAQWEKDNASTLPPGYKEMMQGNRGITQQMQQMQQMLQQVLASGQGVADAARAGQQDARQTQIGAVQRTIANNVDRAQQQLGLKDEEAEQFMTFAAERGYMLEDFADPSLALKVMQDYKNNANSPEFDRLMDISKRRQAWTGANLGGAPAGPEGTVPTEGSGSAMFDKLSQSVMDKRQL